MDAALGVSNGVIDHFTLMWLVASWPLNENEAGGALFLIETPPLFLSKLLLINMTGSIINIRKARRLLPKQGHLQPHFHSKAWQLGKQPLFSFLRPNPSLFGKSPGLF